MPVATSELNPDLEHSQGRTINLAAWVTGPGSSFPHTVGDVITRRSAVCHVTVKCRSADGLRESSPAASGTRRNFSTFAHKQMRHRFRSLLLCAARCDGRRTVTGLSRRTPDRRRAERGQVAVSVPRLSPCAPTDFRLGACHVTTITQRLS